MHKYIEFIGDFKFLKKIDFDFGYAFSSRYKSWTREGISVWKKGMDVTINQLPDHHAVAYELLIPLFDKKDFKIEELFLQKESFFKKTTLDFYVNRNNNEITLDITKFKKEEHDFIKLFLKDTPTEEMPVKHWQRMSVLIEDIQTLYCLHNNKMIKVSIR